MASVPNVPPADGPATPPLTCRLCGCEHRMVALRRGQRAACTRCGTLLARRSWLGRDAALAFAVTAAALAVPALMLPFIVVERIGREHTALALTGVRALWEDGMRLLAVWVAICGAVAPAVLLGALIVLMACAKFGGDCGVSLRWHRLAHAVEHWAMPEVHVLAVLVALIKLGSLVNVHIGPGFWCYVAMSVALLAAWRSFDLETPGPGRAPRPAAYGS